MASCGCGGNGGAGGTGGTGGAAVWVVIVLVLVALAIGVFMFQRSDTAGPGQAGNGPLPFDRQAAQTQLEKLQEQLASAMENQRVVAALVADARQLVQTYPSFTPAYMHLAKALLYNRQPEDAYQQLVTALEMDPRQPDVQVFAGTLATMLGLHVDAQRHYSQAVGLVPNNGRYRLRLAQAQVRQNKFDKARLTLLEALRIDSTLHEAHYALSDMYARQGKLALALAQIARALEVCPPDYEHRVVYVRKFAALLRRDNQPAEALGLLEQLPASQRLEHEVIADMAACWAMMQQPANAARYYEAALAVVPDDPHLAAAAARWYLKAADPQAARHMLQRLRKINPVDPEIIEIEKLLADNVPTTQPGP